MVAIVEGKHAVIVGDRVLCNCPGGPHKIVSGSPSNFYHGIPFARVGDKGSCGATITTGTDKWRMLGAGRFAALDGSRTSCGGYVQVDMGLRAQASRVTETRGRDFQVTGQQGATTSNTAQERYVATSSSSSTVDDPISPSPATIASGSDHERGPGKWVTINIEYNGINNTGVMIANRLTSMGDEGRIFGSDGKDYANTSREVIQEWQPLSVIEEASITRSAIHKYGETRKIIQNYRQGPDHWPVTGESWHWQPVISEVEYEEREEDR